MSFTRSLKKVSGGSTSEVVAETTMLTTLVLPIGTTTDLTTVTIIMGFV